MEIRDMITISDRIKMAKMFEDWASIHNAKVCPENVICFLQNNGLLNKEKTLEFARGEKQTPIDDLVLREPTPQQTTEQEYLTIRVVKYAVADFIKALQISGAKEFCVTKVDGDLAFRISTDELDKLVYGRKEKGECVNGSPKQSI